MRLALAFALTLTLLPSLSAQTNRLMGAWKLYSFDYNGQMKNVDTTELKMYTEHNFVWVDYRADGDIARAGGGTYTYADPQVTEHLEFTGAGNKNLRNVSQQVFVKFQDDDTYIATSSLKAQNGQRLRITEVWKRQK